MKFPELRTFMRETIRHQTALPRVQRDVKALQVRWKGLRANEVWPLTHEDLLKLLPDQDTTDRHVRLYFDTLETTYRIVHYQTFYEQYELLWESPHEVKPASVIIVLLVLASVSCMFPHEHPKYIGDSSLSREKSTFLIEVAEKWLSLQSDKHVYLAIWQIRCLIILAKQINVIKKKRIWTAAGTLLREAMSSGFHRDPSLLGDKVSFFDQEMRRRLWATIIELELQISTDRGMPSASAGLPSDTATVLNVHDSELTNNGRPTSRPLKEHTSASYLHISRSSFSLRVSLNSLVNDLSSPLLYDQVLNYEDAITKELRKLPQVTERQGTQYHNDGASVMAWTLLDIQLRQFLIMLHSPFARQVETNSRFLLSRVTCLDAAVQILKKYSYINKIGNLALLLLRNDPFRIALAICQTTYINISIQSKSQSWNDYMRYIDSFENAGNLILNSNSAMLIQYVEESLVMLETKITQHGTGYTYYWYISAASALLRAMLVPEEASREKEEAISRVTRQYYRILAWQEEPVKARDIIVPIRPNNVSIIETKKS
jgi:Fungal specific transcription factor domain